MREERNGSKRGVSNLASEQASYPWRYRCVYTYVVETGADGDGKGNESANGTAGSSPILGLNTDAAVGDTSGEEGGVGGVDERGGGSVEFSEEDEEEGEGSRLGEVAVGTNGTLELGKLGGAVDLLVTRTVDAVGLAGAEVDVGVESVDDDVGREVRVVAGEEGRVRQGGLSRSNEVADSRMIHDISTGAF